MRGQHWLFSIGPNGGSVPHHPSDLPDVGTLTPATAKLFTSGNNKNTHKNRHARKCSGKLRHTTACAHLDATTRSLASFFIPTLSFQIPLALILVTPSVHWYRVYSSRILTFACIDTDYGRPLGNMTAVPGKQNVFQRKFEKATVTLDCNNWTPTFHES
jgi:hypothetical protein